MSIIIRDGANAGNLVKVDGQGNLSTAIIPAAPSSTAAAWTNATAINSTVELLAAGGGYPAILLQLNQGGTITGGAVTIEGTYDGTNWVTVPVAQILDPNTFAQLTNPYTFVSATNKPFLIIVAGYQQIRINLSTVITGSGTVTPFWSLLTVNPFAGTSTIGGVVTVKNLDEFIAGFVPDPGNAFQTGFFGAPSLDANGQLISRSLVLTDEGSFRDDFPGSSLTTTLTGTLDFTNGQTNVTGSGTSFTTEVQRGQFIKQNTDPETRYVIVAAINSDTQLTLASPYTGTTSLGATAVVSLWATSTGAGGSISVTTSDAQIASGTTINSITGILSGTQDYLPLIMEVGLSISQAIANQNIVFGVQDVFANANAQVVVVLSGTNPAVGNFVTSFTNDVNETTTVPFAFPAGDALGQHKYRISLVGNNAYLSIDDTIVAQTGEHIPGPYTVVTPVIYIQNTGVPSSSTTINADYVYFSDVDRLEISNQFDKPIIVQSTDSSAGSPNTAVQPSTATQIAGWDGTNLRVVNTDAAGQVKVLVQNTVTVSGTINQGTPNTAANSWPVEITDGTNVLGTSLHPVRVDPTGTTTQPVSGTVTTGAGSVSTQVQPQIAGQVPDQFHTYPIGTGTPFIDSRGLLATRSQVLTDEGSFRQDFSTSFLSTLTGTVQFTNNSTAITGSGTLFTQEVQPGNFIKKLTDSETLYVVIASVNSDTSLTLASPYQGTTASATGEQSLLATQTPAGSSISVAASRLNIAANVASGDVVGVSGGTGDYLPILLQGTLSVSQAVANQHVVFGLQDAPGTAWTQRAVVELDGTDPTIGSFVTNSSTGGSDVEDTQFVYPNGGTFLTDHDYRINCNASRIELVVDGVVVATHTLHLVDPYKFLIPVAYIQNTGVVSSSTTLSIEYVYFNDSDRLETTNTFNESVASYLTGPTDNNVPVRVTPYGHLLTQETASQLFYDTFDAALDTTNRWTATAGNGGVPPTSGTIDAGSTSLDPGTTVNGFSLLTSKPLFPLTLPGYLYAHFAINLDFPVTTNNYRFWGLGNPLATPTLTTPLVDAVGFEIGVDGKMYAVTYAGTGGVTTTRNVIADLSPSGNNSQPQDTAAHIYYIYFKGFIAYWAIDSSTNIVASIATGALGPNNNTMGLTVVSISDGTSGTLIVDGVSLGDTGRNNLTISDSMFRWREVTVKPASTVAVTGDAALVTALHPSTPLPAGSNNIGSVNAIQSGSWTVTAVQPTAGNLNATVTGTVNTVPPANASTNLTEIGGTAVGISNPLFVEVTDGTHTLPTGDSALRPIHTNVDNTVTVSGTVSVSNSFALDATLTNGTQITKVSDGTNTIFTSAHPAFVQGQVNLQDGAGTPLTSTLNSGKQSLDVNVTGGATNVQYASGTVNSTPTGTVAMGLKTSTNTILPLPLDGSGFLAVSVQGGITVTGGSFVAAANGVTGQPVPSYADFIGWQDNSGNLQGVSLANPLPIQGSISATNPSVGLTGATAPTSATEIGFISGGNLVSPSAANPLPVVAAGSLTDNNAAPSTNNLGVLPAVVNYKPPVRTQGDLSTLSVDVNGFLRTRLYSDSPLGDGVAMPRQNQIEANFSEGFNSALVTNTLTGTATATATGGTAIYATGTTAGSRAIGQSTQQLSYKPGHTWYASFTAAFSAGGSGASWQRIGPFNSTDGFYIGYEGNVFNFTQLQAGSATHVAKSSWNGDPVDGSVNSRFTSSGNPVALDFSKINIYRIHGAWFGVSPISLEVFSPDGVWVNLHTFHFPNTLTAPFTATTNFNITVDVNNDVLTTNLTINTPCWAMGVINASAASDNTNASAAVWNSATPNNSFLTVPVAFGASTVTIGLVQTTTITGGAVQFQVSDDNVNWFVTNAINVEAQTVVPDYNFQANTNAYFVLDVTGKAFFRLFMTSAITGSGSVTVQYGTAAAVGSTNEVYGTVSTFADTVNGGTSAPGKGLLIVGKTNDGTPQYQPIPLDAGGIGVLTVPYDAYTANLATWTSGTGGGTHVTVPNNYNTVRLSLIQGSTITGGSMTIEGSQDNSNWFTLNFINPFNGALMSNYSFQQSTNIVFVIDALAWKFVRVTLATPITGTGSVQIQSGTDVSNNPYTTIVQNNVGVTATQQGNWTTRIVGNAGALIDAAIGGSQPANQIQVGGQVSTSNPTYTNATQNTFSLTTVGSVRMDLTSVAGTALTAVPATFGSAPTGSVQGVNASIFAGTTSVPSGTFGTSPTAVAGTLPVNASLFVGTTAITTTGVAGQPKVGIVGSTGTSFETTAGVLDENIKNVGNAAVTTVAAGTQKVGIADSAGNAFTSNQTTQSRSLDVNVVSVLGATMSNTNPMFTSITDGTTKVTVIAATAALKTDLSSVAGTATSTAAAGVQKVGIVGNTGASVDSTIGAGTAPTNMVAVGGQYNTTIPTPTAAQALSIQLDSTGSTYINTEGRKTTYRVGIVGFTPIASATAPAVSITGSATKTVRITRIVYSASASTGAVSNIQVNRFTALTGGTPNSQAANIAKLDSNNAAATAVVNQWSAAATTATSAGILIAKRYEVVTAAVSVQPGEIEWKFGDDNGQGLVLRGTAEFAGIILSAVGTTPVADCWVEWTEE